MGWFPCDGCGSPPFTCNQCSGDRPDQLSVYISGLADFFGLRHCPFGDCPAIDGTYTLDAYASDSCIWQYEGPDYPNGFNCDLISLVFLYWIGGPNGSDWYLVMSGPANSSTDTIGRSGLWYPTSALPADCTTWSSEPMTWDDTGWTGTPPGVWQACDASSATVEVSAL